MIVRSRYVKDDPGRAGHLLSTSNNRRVVEHRDLDRGCPGDLRQFLAFSSALTAAHPRAKITLAHFKISPSRPLNRRQLLRTIVWIKRENGIARDHPMRLVEHDKGDRPPHFHLLFSAVDPATGRVLSSKDNYARDELVSRRLEITFGESITPGPRVQRNAADLRARGDDRDAQILEGYEPVRRRGKDSEADRQQAARAKLSLTEFRGRLLSAVEKGIRSGLLPRALVEQGFSIAVGTRKSTLMAVHDATGMALPLLASITIASDGRMALGPSMVEELRRDAPPLAQARIQGAARTLRRAKRDLDREIDRGRFEAAVDGECNDIFSNMRRARKAAEVESAAGRPSQAAQRREALAARRQAARVRQLRIDRAFRAARILQSRPARRMAFAMAAGGVLLTGAGVALALGAGLVASSALRGYGQARRAEAQALIAQRYRPGAGARGRDRRTMEEAIAAKARREERQDRPVVQATPDPKPPPPSRHEQPGMGFDFTTIPKSHRVLAALALDVLAERPVLIARDVLERVLGTEVFSGLASLAEKGSSRRRRHIQSWNGGRSADAFAAESALRRAGENDAAKVMARIGRQRVVTERNRAKGRE
ncbi:hypothetical protein [Bosea sp. (in: a-proteobacteria)]|uniref:hypothetical protein n=1 Tax=Bosea sp. (in: a-proteobacteria) TaxID=1871050 RepID=UPI001AD25175|nr:hypothetical protein [Bosea sp. (in: a-proteobacteria)]MBN9438466.1 hypothetical protein [Bosea sp. (in: a-proteobacteria)]